MDDLLQEAFLQVFQSLKGWRAEASLATWIDRVAVRVAYRYLTNRRRRGQMLELVEDEAIGVDGAAIAAVMPVGGARRQLARDGVRRLYAVLDGLSPAARLAFTLHEIDGRSMAQVAEGVGATVTATKLRELRARRPD